jgi:maltose phosphorylase
VHESSLSPCVHVILASKIGYKEKAYEMYLRTSRLDLDDYNNDTEDGCHITSMAGTWMSVVKGFGGMRVQDGILHFNPFIPDQWRSYSFRIDFRGRVINVKVSKSKTETILESGEPMEIVLGGVKKRL